MTVKEVKTIGTILPEIKESIKYDVIDDITGWTDSAVWCSDHKVFGTTFHLGEDCILIESLDYTEKSYYVIPISELIRIGIVKSTQTNMKTVTAYKVLKLVPLTTLKIGQIIPKNGGVFEDCKNYPEFFEPLYANYYKVGDWILTSNNAGGWGFSRSEIANKILQITELDDQTDGHGNVYVRFGKLTTNIKEIVRFATKEEITSAQEIKIGDYTIKFEDNHAIIDNNTYSKAELQIIRKVLELRPFQIKSLNVGCNGQYKIDLPFINKVLERLNF